MDMELARNKGPSDITTAVGQLGPVGELFTVRLQRAEYLLSRETSKAWTGHRLRTGTIGVLSQIAQVPGISQNELSKRTTYDKSAINAIVNSLEELGWAERQAVRQRSP